MYEAESNEAGTDNPCAILTQGNLTARVKKQQLPAEGGTMLNCKETRKDKMKRSFPSSSCSLERMTKNSAGTGMIGAELQMRSSGASKYIAGQGPRAVESPCQEKVMSLLL